MREQLDNNIFVSFKLWYDHVVTVEGQGYTNISGQLYEQSDDKLGGLYAYASPNKQWIADSSATGAYIPSGVFVDNSFVPFTGTSLFADWDNGRIISDSEITGSITVAYSTKDLNTYVTNDTEENIIFQNRYQVNDYYSLPASGIAPYELALPASFLTIHNTESDTYAIGSSDFQKEKIITRAIVISNNTFHIDACLSLFRQKKDKCFPLLGFSNEPFHALGGLKSSFSGSYDYTENLNQGHEKVFIEKVNTSKFFAGSHEFMPNGMKVAFISFELRYHRE